MTVNLLSILPQDGKNITDLSASLVKELETCLKDNGKLMGTNVDCGGETVT